MKNNYKDYYIVTSDGRPGQAAVGYLDGVIDILKRDYKDKSINLTIWEGRNPTGVIVAERIDGEWRITDEK